MPDAPPMDAEKAAELANEILDRCYDAQLNRFEILTALGLVVQQAFEDVPGDYLEGWITTLRRKVAGHDA